MKNSYSNSQQAIEAAKETGDVIHALDLGFVAYCESHDVICAVGTIAPWDDTVLIDIVADDLTKTRIDLPLPSGAQHDHSFLVAEKIAKGKLDGWVGKAIEWTNNKRDAGDSDQDEEGLRL